MLAGLGRALRSGRRQLPVLLGRRDGCPLPSAPQVRRGAGEDPRGTAAGTGRIAPHGCWRLARLCPRVRRGRRATNPGASVSPAGLGPPGLGGSAARLACPGRGGRARRGAVTHGRRPGPGLCPGDSRAALSTARSKTRVQKKVSLAGCRGAAAALYVKCCL